MGTRLNKEKIIIDQKIYHIIVVRTRREERRQFAHNGEPSVSNWVVRFGKAM